MLMVSLAVSYNGFIATLYRIASYHSKKGTVTLTSELLFEFQKCEHSEARAKLVCVSGGSSSKIHSRCITNVLISTFLVSNAKSH